MKYRFAWRRVVNTIMFTLAGACAAAASAVLLGILGYLAWNGGKALNPDFFLQLPRPPGEPGGGMANALAGSLKILLIAAAFGIPVGFLGGVYLAEFGGAAASFVVRYVADLLNGVPSIVIGICAYSILVVPMGGFSAFAGGAALSIILIPLVVRSTEEFLRRTVEEGRKVIEAMRANGLAQGEDGLEVYAMCELPSNVVLASEFLKIFDGYSIGSNDLTQLTLGLDRDSGTVARLFDENNPAVKHLIQDAIRAAQQAGKPIGICGQAPSDFPEFADWLVGLGIDSIALNPDTAIQTALSIARAEAAPARSTTA